MGGLWHCFNHIRWQKRFNAIIRRPAGLPWRGFFCLVEVETPPPFPLRLPLCWAQLCPRLFPCVCYVMALLRFLYPILDRLDPLVFVPNAFYTHNISRYGLFQNPGLHTRLGLDFELWFEQNQCFLRQNRLLHKELLYTKTILYTNTMWGFLKIGVPLNHPLNNPFGGAPIYGNPQVLHENLVLAGPGKGKPCGWKRIGFSMPAKQAEGG